MNEDVAESHDKVGAEDGRANGGTREASTSYAGCVDVEFRWSELGGTSELLMSGTWRDCRSSALADHGGV